MNDKILFVWDFHGVLEKGNIYAVQELTNLVLKDFKINRQISIEETIEWYGLSWFDYFRLSAPEKNAEVWHEMVDRVIIFQQKGWSILEKHLRTRDFAEEVLTKINEEGHHNIILSNTYPDHIRNFTDLLKISDYFYEIIGVDSHHKNREKKEIYKVKTDVLNNFIEGKGYKKIVAIGDKESDIKAGKICGAITYLFVDKEVTKIIPSTESNYTITDLRELLKEL